MSQAVDIPTDVAATVLDAHRIGTWPSDIPPLLERRHGTHPAGRPWTRVDVVRMIAPPVPPRERSSHVPADARQAAEASTGRRPRTSALVALAAAAITFGTAARAVARRA